MGLDKITAAHSQMVEIEVAAARLLRAIKKLRALFPDGEVPHYLGYVEAAINECEPTLKDIAGARPY